SIHSRAMRSISSHSIATSSAEATREKRMKPCSRRKSRCSRVMAVPRVNRVVSGRSEGMRRRRGTIAQRSWPDDAPSTRRMAPWSRRGVPRYGCRMAPPPTGRPAGDVLARLDALQARDVDWRGGRAFRLAYHAGDDVLAVGTEAQARYLSTNALNPAAFPSLRTLQSEVVATVAELL